ncbi:MAG: tRNA A-37 threonylcarbamoyl transferase component Bud32 [Chlamydiales bacterium]|jgi:tRNA A-37 threonylcarbamoyl transferase component Bud32
MTLQVIPLGSVFEGSMLPSIPDSSHEMVDQLNEKVQSLFQDIENRVLMDQHPSYMYRDLEGEIASIQREFSAIDDLNEEQKSQYKTIDMAQRVLRNGKGLLETKVRGYSSVFFEKQARWLPARLESDGLNTHAGVDKSLCLIDPCEGKPSKCVMVWRARKEDSEVFESNKSYLDVEFALFDEVSRGEGSSVLPSLESHLNVEFQDYEENLLIMPFIADKSKGYFKKIDTSRKFIGSTFYAFKALNSIHRKGIFHGDCTLDNFIVDASGKFNIIDLIGSIRRECKREDGDPYSQQNDLSTLMKDLIDRFALKFPEDSATHQFMNNLSHIVDDFEFADKDSRNEEISERWRAMEVLAPSVDPLLVDFAKHTANFFKKVSSKQASRELINYVPEMCAMLKKCFLMHEKRSSQASGVAEAGSKRKSNGESEANSEGVKRSRVSQEGA